MHVRFWELGDREVVNCKDGKCLGHVGDVEIDLSNGCITHFFIPAGSKYCGCFGKKSEYRIPYCSVIKIGIDIILVDIDEKKCLEKP